MENWFVVGQLDIERLLADWRWLCPKPMTLLARSAFGDLFLRDESGEVFGLDVAAGKLTKIADSEAEFRELAASQEKRAEWFREAAEQSALARGLKPMLLSASGLACRSSSLKAALPTPPTSPIYTNIFRFSAT